MAHIDMRTGNGWQRLNSNNVRIWNGSSWQRPKARIWNGHDWIECLEERHVDTWDCTWSNGYWSDWHNNEAKGKWGGLVWAANHPLQGSYAPYRDHWDWGNEGGMMGFDDGNIRWKLQGARIEKVELYLQACHFGYYSGGEAVIGTHNARGWQEYFSEINHGIVHARYYSRTQGQWIQLPNWVGDNFRDNKLAGFTTKADSPNLWQYGVFEGSDSGWKKPKLRITYWK